MFRAVGVWAVFRFIKKIIERNLPRKEENFGKYIIVCENF